MVADRRQAPSTPPLPSQNSTGTNRCPRRPNGWRVSYMAVCRPLRRRV